MADSGEGTGEPGATEGLDPTPGTSSEKGATPVNNLDGKLAETSTEKPPSLKDSKGDHSDDCPLILFRVLSARYGKKPKPKRSGARTDSGN